MENILVLDKINKYFPGVHALKDMSLSIREGEVQAICGGVRKAERYYRRAGAVRYAELCIRHRAQRRRICDKGVMPMQGENHAFYTTNHNCNGALRARHRHDAHLWRAHEEKGRTELSSPLNCQNRFHLFFMQGFQSPRKGAAPCSPPESCGLPEISANPVQSV